MKQINTKKIIKFAVVLAIIIAGIIMVAVKGFKFDLNYEAVQKLEIYIGKSFDIKDIKEITDQTLQGKDVIIEKVEVFEDMVSIKSKEITEEEKNNIVTKINEKYSLDNKAEEVNVISVPHTRFLDIYKKYIVPVIVSMIIVLVYIAIRFRNIGIIKSLVDMILTVGVSEAVLMSVIALFRIPVGRISTALILLVYVISITFANFKLEDKLNLKKLEDNK